MNSKKIFSFLSMLIIFSLCLSIPLSAFAQAVHQSVSTLRAQSAAISAQGAAEKGGTGTAPTPASDTAAGGLAVAAGTCSIGTLAANMLTSAIAGIVGSIFGTAKKVATDKATGALTSKVDAAANSAVPTIILGDAENHLVSIDTGLANLNKKSTSLSASPAGWDGIKSSLSDLFSAPSLDAIGFCVANEMITYIANSTITWINTGFKGSPVFVSNTGQFLKGVEDQELGNFVNGVAQGTLGINLCQPFKVEVLTSVLGGPNVPNPLSCTLSKIKQNYNQFTNGDWNSGGFPGWFELIQDQNNVYGATIAAKDQAYINITTKQNTAIIDLNWAKGYRNFTACADKSTPDPKTGMCVNGMPEVTTLGGYIENQVNVRGASGSNRLNIATSFDQVVSALVNELIKIAINKVFDTSGNSNYTPIPYANYPSGSNDNSSGSTATTYSPLGVTCSANNNAYLSVGTDTSSSTAEVQWTAYPTGGSGSYSFSWSGAVSGTDQSDAGEYTASGTEVAAITIFDTATGKTAAGSCFANIYDPLTASCTATPSGSSIAWAASAAGGTGNYTYSWSGAVSGSNQSGTVSYNPGSGTQNATVTVFDSNTSANATCSASI